MRKSVDGWKMPGAMARNCIREWNGNPFPIWKRLQRKPGPKGDARLIIITEKEYL